MPRGRCSGCGREDASAQKIRSHILSCPDYLTLYREDPSRARDPEEEARHHADHKSTDEYELERQDRKDANARRYRDQNERRVEVAQERWRRGSPGAHGPVAAPPNGRLTEPPDTPGGRVERDYYAIMTDDPTA